MSTPNYTREDWERIGETPGGGILSRLKIHSGWLVRETAPGGGVALCHVADAPNQAHYCFKEWNARYRRDEDEALPEPVVTNVTTPRAETAADAPEKPVEVKTE